MVDGSDRTQADVVVIGLGPGGEQVAGQLAEAGLDVVGVEAELVGGECPYWACVPSKMMIRAANLLAEARRVPGMAGAAAVTPDFGPVARRIREEATSDWNDRQAADRLAEAGGRLVRGRGVLAGPRTVRVVSGPDAGLEIHAKRGVVLATGTRPAAPPVPGLAAVPYWTNREAVAATEAPASLAVLGAGPVGVELAQVFARFGSRVTIVETGDHPLPREEPEAGELLARTLAAEGVTLLPRTRARHVAGDDERVTLTLDRADGAGGAGDGGDGGDGDGTRLTASRLLVATGRRPALADLGLDTVPGLDPGPDARALPVDGRMRTAADGVWAVGDLTGHGAFTHVAVYQAEIAVRDVLGRPGPEADYHALPRVTFTDPEVGAVGLTEAQARERGIAVRTGFAELPSAARGWIHKAGNDGFVKLVEDADAGVLVGATTVGPTGGETLYGLAVAVQARVPTDQLRHMIHAYPTFHRAVSDALRGLGAA